MGRITNNVFLLGTTCILWSLLMARCANALESNVIEGETCITYDFHQNVTKEGCESKNINTKACFGQCKSGIVSGAGNTMMSCKSCWPTKLRTRVVNLRCHAGPDIQVEVVEVMYCQCTQRRCPTKSGYEKNEIVLPASTTKSATESPVEKLRRRLKKRRRRCRSVDHNNTKAKERCVRKIREIKRKLKETKASSSSSATTRNLDNEKRRTFLHGKFRGGSLL